MSHKGPGCRRTSSAPLSCSSVLGQWHIVSSSDVFVLLQTFKLKPQCSPPHWSKGFSSKLVRARTVQNGQVMVHFSFNVESVLYLYILTYTVVGCVHVQQFNSTFHGTLVLQYLYLLDGMLMREVVWSSVFDNNNNNVCENANWDIQQHSMRLIFHLLFCPSCTVMVRMAVVSELGTRRSCSYIQSNVKPIQVTPGVDVSAINVSTLCHQSIWMMSYLL